MVYHISNRVLYRGFHRCPGSRKKIIRQDGTTVKGEWLTGQLVEIPMETPPGARPQMPILCLGAPGKRLGSVSARSVYPDTLSQFSWTYVDTKWELLPKKEQERWIQSHQSGEWKGIPIFEGDIFLDALDREYYVAECTVQEGFRLRSVQTGKCEPWEHSLKKLKGNLWEPPKDLDTELLQVFHRARRAGCREEALSIAI